MTRNPKAFDPILLPYDNQAEEAYAELLCERARETFIDVLAKDSGRTRAEVERIVNENFPKIAGNGNEGFSGKKHPDGAKAHRETNAASGLCELYPVVNLLGVKDAKNRDAAFDSESEVNGIDKGQTPPADSQNIKPNWTWEAIGWLLLGVGIGLWMFYEGMN